jgi:CheY-like chemotaxis protein
MMGIQGNISLMRMEMPPDTDIQNRCQTIEELVQKGAALTRQLLGVAKGGKYQQIPTDISKLAAASLEMFGRTRKEIQTHIETDPHPCVSEVDPGQIDQVLLNLFVNAWQAMPEGGNLHVETRHTSVNGRDFESTNLKPGPYVKITIRDTGTGIDRTIIDKIFDPFFTTKEKGRGTGLGLASAYGIIKNHGGIIQVESRVNEGTSFEIFLPASEKTSAVKTSGTCHIIEGQETVLIVDDEAAVLEICGEMLKRLGYSVLTAITGEEAIARFKAEKDDIDLVILDLVMPGINGEGVYSHLTELKPDIPVLIASGYALEDQARKLLSRGAAGFIQKPYSVMDLSRKVRQVLSES